MLLVENKRNTLFTAVSLICLLLTFSPLHAHYHNTFYHSAYNFSSMSFSCTSNFILFITPFCSFSVSEHGRRRPSKHAVYVFGPCDAYSFAFWHQWEFSPHAQLQAYTYPLAYQTPQSYRVSGGGAFEKGQFDFTRDLTQGLLLTDWVRKVVGLLSRWVVIIKGELCQITSQSWISLN